MPGIQKFGKGEVLPDEGDTAKTAQAQPWTEKDQAELQAENAKADQAE